MNEQNRPTTEGRFQPRDEEIFPDLDEVRGHMGERQDPNPLEPDDTEGHGRRGDDGHEDGAPQAQGSYHPAGPSEYPAQAVEGHGVQHPFENDEDPTPTPRRRGVSHPAQPDEDPVTAVEGHGLRHLESSDESRTGITGQRFQPRDEDMFPEPDDVRGHADTQDTQTPDASDTEGHLIKHGVTSPNETDVEGHGLKHAATFPTDVEGHSFRHAEPVDESEVEGHSFKHLSPSEDANGSPEHGTTSRDEGDVGGHTFRHGLSGSDQGDVEGHTLRHSVAEQGDSEDANERSYRHI